MPLIPTQLGATHPLGAPIAFRRARALSGDERCTRDDALSVSTYLAPRGEIRTPHLWLYRATTRSYIGRRCEVPVDVHLERAWLPFEDVAALRVPSSLRQGDHLFRKDLR